MSGLVGPALNFNKTYPERVAYIHTKDPQYTMLWRRFQSPAQQVAQQQLNQQGFAPTKNNRIDFGGEYPAPIALQSTGAPGCSVDLNACTGCAKPTPWSQIFGDNGAARSPCPFEKRKFGCGARYHDSVIQKPATPAVANPTAIAKNLANDIVAAAGAVEKVLTGAVQAPNARGGSSMTKIDLNNTAATKSATLSHYALTHANVNGKQGVKDIYQRNCRSCGVYKQ